MRRSKFKDCAAVEFLDSSLYYGDPEQYAEFHIEFRESGVRWAITIEKDFDRAQVSVYDLDWNVPKPKPRGYLPKEAAEFIKWFVKNECTK